jgi:hypothetical protein
MKRWLAVFCLLVTGGFAVTPRFVGPSRVQNGGADLQADLYCAPCVYDWDGDSKKDLIVGQFTGGYIRFYPNVGTDASPVFNGFSFLMASGSQITMPSG